MKVNYDKMVVQHFKLVSYRFRFKKVTDSPKHNYGIKAFFFKSKKTKKQKKTC